jgi:hypothetical protein
MLETSGSEACVGRWMQEEDDGDVLAAGEETQATDTFDG